MIKGVKMEKIDKVVEEKKVCCSTFSKIFILLLILGASGFLAFRLTQNDTEIQQNDQL